MVNRKYKKKGVQLAKKVHCNNCNVKHPSKFSHRVCQFLYSLGYKVKSEVKLDGLKFERQLSIDFYHHDLESGLRFSIEVDGKQHIHNSCRDPMTFVNQVTRDMFKTKYHIDNGIHLFRLSYEDSRSYRGKIVEFLKRINSPTYHSPLSDYPYGCLHFSSMNKIYFAHSTLYTENRKIHDIISILCKQHGLLEC